MPAREGAHPVRGQDRSPPSSTEYVANEPFCLHDADIRRTTERGVRMPTKRLPVRPDIAHLKHQAKDLLNDHRAATLDACQRIREFHPRLSGAPDRMVASATFTLADAYLTVAREYGFPSWARLR